MNRLRRSEEGLGLIELMISIVLIGMILMGLAMSLITSLGSIRVAEKTSLATAIHQEMLERDLALPWALIGIYTDDPDYVATVEEDSETLDTAGITPITPRDSRIQPRVRTVEREGVDFEVVRDVYWVDADGDGTTEGKRIRTTITWADGDTTATSVFHALRLPSDEEQEDGFEISLFEPSPSVVQLDSSDRTTEEVLLTVNTSQTSLAPTVTYDTTAGTATATGWVANNGDSTSWTGRIAVGSGPMDVDDGLLRLSVTNTESPAVTRTSAVTLTYLPDGAVAPPADFTIQQFTASPVTAKATDHRALCPVEFTVRVNGFTSEDLVEVEYEYWEVVGNGNNAEYAKTGSGSVQTEFLEQNGSVATFVGTHTGAGDEHYLAGESINVTVKATRADVTPDRTETLSDTLAFVSSGHNNKCA